MTVLFFSTLFFISGINMRHNIFSVATEGREVNQPLQPGTEGFVIDFFKDLFRYKHTGEGFVQAAKLGGFFTTRKLSKLYDAINKYYTNMDWLHKQQLNQQPFMYNEIQKLLPVDGVIEDTDDLVSLVGKYIDNREYIDSVVYSYMKEVEGFERRFIEDMADCYYLSHERVYKRLDELKKAALTITPLHERIDVKRLHVVGGKVVSGRDGIKFLPNLRAYSQPIKPLDAEGIMIMGAGIKNMLDVVNKDSQSDKLINLMDHGTFSAIANKISEVGNNDDTTVEIDLSSFAAKKVVPKKNRNDFKKINGLYHYHYEEGGDYRDILYTDDGNAQYYIESIIESDAFGAITNHIGAFAVYENALAPAHKSIQWFEVVKALDFIIAKSISKNG